MKILFVSEKSERSSLDLKKVDPEEFIMIVDGDRCISCGACELACQLEGSGSTAIETSYKPIKIEAKRGRNGGRIIRFPLSCRHCGSPCEYYSQYNFWTICPKEEQNFKICDFCISRTDRGLWPACATRCAMKAIYFGKAGDMAFTLKEKRIRGMGDVTLS